MISVAACHISAGVQMQKESFTAHFWDGVQIQKEFFAAHFWAGVQMQKVTAHFWAGACPDPKSYSTLLGWCMSRSKKLQHTSGLVHVQMQKGTAHFWAGACPDAAHFWAGVHASVIYFVTRVICCSYIYDMWTSVQVLQVYILGQCPGVAGSMFMCYKYPGQADAQVM